MKKLVFLVAACAGMAAMASMNDALLTFSTPGPDRYADGSVVLDGECYALVWTKDGASFAGVKTDGSPVAETDKVVLVAPLAKNGACPRVLFQIDAKVADSLEGGTYAVYLLDTRVKAAGGSVALAGLEDGKPVAVNGQAAVSASGNAEAANPGSLQIAASAVGGAAVTAESIIDVPKITGIKIDGAKIKVTVAGMSPVATYKVVAGDRPGEINKQLDAEAKGDTFEFAKPKGQFFKVIGVRNF